MLLDLADQLDSFRTGSPQSKGSVPRLGDKDGPKYETPKKRKSANTEGHTQWKFQKSKILHHILDVIPLHMEDSKRCLDFHDSMPINQTFRHCDSNLHHMKAVMVKEVTHLTMIIMLDENHMHYSDAFRNIFEEDTLCKKSFPDGLEGITMSKGRAAYVIVCCFCPYVCSNDDYAYHHLAATHLNIQWGCRICFDFVNGYVSKIREHVLSHQKRSSKE